MVFHNSILACSTPFKGQPPSMAGLIRTSSQFTTRLFVRFRPPSNIPPKPFHLVRPLATRSSPFLQHHESNLDSPTPRSHRSTRKRPSPSRRRPRPTPPRDLVLPDLGLTALQLAALADCSESRILTCARQLDDTVYDLQTVLSPELILLITEQLNLNLIFRNQTLSFSNNHLPSSSADESLELRMPVVTVMGHVDHGKTSLLDALRKSDVADHEIGGITQSVAAFQVPISNTSSNNQSTPSFATFIDTPGHAAFKTMRANGTVATDIVVLVVAADDGVMPQSIEAANLAKSANVPVIVAINKCDAPGADPERIRYQLVDRLAINTEQLGGDVQCVEISAKTGANLPQLLDAISLQAEMLELRTSVNTSAFGICLESRVDRSLGSIATVVIRRGTLQIGDVVAFQSPRVWRGQLYGHVRGLIGADAKQLRKAGPGLAVGIIGIKDPVPPGAEICVMENEKMAKAKSNQMIARNARAASTIELANLLHAEREAKKGVKDGSLEKPNIAAPKIIEEEPDVKKAPDPRTIMVLVKGDVKGSADAVSQCIKSLGSAQVPIRILDIGVGDVNDMDVKIASATRKVKGNTDIPMVVAFNVRVKNSAMKSAQKAGLMIARHSIIYHLEDEVKEMIAKILKQQQSLEEIVGRASVVRVFEDGTIAGCFVEEGRMSKGDMARVMRMPDIHAEQRVREEVFSGTVDTIKHFTDKVNYVEKGSECGISLKDWDSFEAGDVVECVSVTKPKDTN